MSRLRTIIGARARAMGLDMLAADGLDGAISPAMYPGQPEQVPLANRGPRGLMLGFGPTNVATVATNTFQAQPNLIFRVSRMMALAAVASFFTITDFRIGRTAQFLSPNGVPAAAFAENAVDSGLRGDTSNVGQLLSLTVLNNSGAQLAFSGAAFGVCIDG